MEQVASQRKIILLLACTPSAREMFRLRIGQLSSIPGAGDGERWSLLLEPGEMGIVPHQEVMRDSPAPYDGIVEFACGRQKADDVDTAAQTVAQLEALIDPAKSNALVCDEYQITSGYGPIFVGMALRRLPAMDHAAFMDSWFGRHADIGQAVEGVRYRQDHIVPTETDALASQLGLADAPLDGLTLSYFASTEEAGTLLSTQAIRDAIIDERTFIDHARSQFGIYQVLASTMR